ncbi:HPr family phosphocarrier protein [Amygdalobacter indicium]|jgi:hypothetical protein|uniref:HPr family phosphocarrier protein n=1 Tax=Amygdalobacter indicium TaxID=3029272 RepID=A0ABY8CAV7_9FIRM|nr:HPr family phosphocarrier protein [Amygdalobacter indicium]WEG34385.1 HPr family phosphocarrier protein [Amygdalobacter indicium]WEG35960.1 HPr family phosphocarrier protein [Amygdalobacter indicium]
MLQKTVKFHCQANEQMKLVANLIQKASNYQSHINLETNGRKANCKSLLGMMSLGMQDDCEITITCDGQDEQDAMQELVVYLSK